MTITYDRQENIAVITLDDGKANAVNPDFLAKLNGHLDAAESESGAIIIAGRPGMFCGGFDLKLLQSATPEAVESLIESGGELALRLFTSPKPIIMACSGHAIAQGAAFLLCADLRIGCEGDFKIGLNETGIGMVLRHFGPTLVKARLAPVFHTRAAVVGELFDPETAVQVGYLDETVPPSALMETAIARATQLAALPPEAFAGNKQLMRSAAIRALNAKQPLG